MNNIKPVDRVYTVAHFFCGIGGKGLGARRARAVVGDNTARFRTLGGIDFDPLACKDFEMLVGAPSLCADVHELEPADLVRFFGRTAPDLVMLSPPCKGFSGLLSAKRAAEEHYQRMNQLMERALFLLCSAWPTPPRLVFVENVPRIASRGKETVRRCRAIGESAGYAVTMGTHDCGELGGLAQHRRRWFMVWRHRERTAQFLYEPLRHRVRACGEVLGPLPMPGDTITAGPMHSVPKLSLRNWIRLALIPAGGDWRDLPGVLSEGQARREKFRRDPVTPWESPSETVTGPGGSASANVADPRFGHVDKVTAWDAAVGTITRSPAPSSGAAAVADPRWGGGAFGVTGWNETAATVTGESLPSNGRNAVADPRLPISAAYRGVLGVSGWGDPCATVTGNGRPQSGRFAVADPRFDEGKKKNWQHVAGVTPWTEAAPTVTSGAKIHAGAFQVADPRINCEPRAGAYRVLRWDEASATITASLDIDNGAAAVGDPRLADLNLDKAPPWIPLIVAADGTWHRPLTTFELAMLQSFPAMVDGKPLKLAGDSHTRWREGIGNAVPPDAAEAIAVQMARAMLLSDLGVFMLDSSPIWVSPQAGALVA